MNFNDFNQLIDNAILELIDIKIELSHVQRGLVPPKCNPVIINPASGSECRSLSIDIRAGEAVDPIETAFREWVSDFKNRLNFPDHLPG